MGALKGLGGGGASSATGPQNPVETEGIGVYPPPLAGTPAPQTDQAFSPLASGTEASPSEVYPPANPNVPASGQPEGTPGDQYQSGPILGIVPTENAEEISPLATSANTFEISRPAIHVVEGILGLVAILAGLAAFLFYRREHL